MRIRQLVKASFLLLAFELSAGSSPDRNWQNAQVQQIQRVLDITPRVNHWEYVLTANGLIYALRTGPRDAPYLNSSLGAEVKIGSSSTLSRESSSSHVASHLSIYDVCDVAAFVEGTTYHFSSWTLRGWVSWTGIGGKNKANR